MKTFANYQIGVDAGDVMLFSDFEDGGEMWTGSGPRLCRRAVRFSESYVAAPSVTVHMAMVDMSNDTFIRADLQAENITVDGFDIVFRTWGDSRIARIRVAWQAIGPLPNEDSWTL